MFSFLLGSWRRRRVRRAWRRGDLEFAGALRTSRV